MKLVLCNVRPNLLRNVRPNLLRNMRPNMLHNMQPKFYYSSLNCNECDRKEHKISYIMGDCNINLLNASSHGKSWFFICNVFL